MARGKIDSVLRVLDILECFMDGRTEWTLKALSEALDIPATTLFYQLSTLTSRQYLVQDPVRKSYQLGPRFLLLCSSIMGQADLRRVARPCLERLCDAVCETINLCVLIDHDIFYLDKVETQRSVACTNKLGTRVAAYTSSAGKALLSTQSPEFIDAYCQWMSTAEPLTKNTITDPEALRAELARVRSDGYASDNGEIEPNLICYGAPIFDYTGKAAAAVSVAGPNYRMKENQPLIIREVKRTAAEISSLLGCRTP